MRKVKHKISIKSGPKRTLQKRHYKWRNEINMEKNELNMGVVIET